MSSHHRRHSTEAAEAAVEAITGAANQDVTFSLR